MKPPRGMSPHAVSSRGGRLFCPPPHEKSLPSTGGLATLKPVDAVLGGHPGQPDEHRVPIIRKASGGPERSQTHPGLQDACAPHPAGENAVGREPLCAFPPAAHGNTVPSPPRPGPAPWRAGLLVPATFLGLGDQAGPAPLSSSPSLWLLPSAKSAGPGAAVSTHPPRMF